MTKSRPRSLTEKLLYIGIFTFALWPLTQIWSVKAVPLFNSDVYIRASIALENLIEEALAKPYERVLVKPQFTPIKGCEDFGLVGRVEVSSHPDFKQCVLLCATVKWGLAPFSKTLSLEYLRSRTTP